MFPLPDFENSRKDAVECILVTLILLKCTYDYI